MLKKVASLITHPFIAGPLGGGFIVLLAYLDSRFKDLERDTETYWKLFIVSSLVFATITYFVSAEHTKIDEFLEQSYDTAKPATFSPKSKGGFFKKQPMIEGPDTRVSDLMGGLPSPGTFSKKSKMNTSNVSMRIRKR